MILYFLGVTWYYNQSVTAIMPYHVTMTIVTDIHVLEWDYLVLFSDKDWILNLIEEFLVIIVTSKSSVRKEIEK